MQGIATVACVFPLATGDTRLWLKQRWSRQLLAMLGVRLRSHGALPARSGLVVSNHVSWLDIFVIDALHPGAFVCKDDVRAWPVIGWLVARTGNLFIARGNRRAAGIAAQAIRARLAAGATVVAFPEGTTSGGDTVLPFHGALLQPAIDADVPVQPLALRYVDAQGPASSAPAYVTEVTLWQSLWRIAREPALRAEVAVLPACIARERRHAAAQAHAAIAACIAPSRASAFTPSPRGATLQSREESRDECPAAEAVV